MPDVGKTGKTGKTGNTEQMEWAAAGRARLREIIVAKSLLSGGDFQLASGKTSSVFFDMKPAMLDPEGANLIAAGVLDLLRGDNDVDHIGGLVMGAVPLIGAVCVRSFPDRPLAGFFVRKEPKERGTRRMIEGNLAPGASVALLEDVTTTGGSVLKAVAAVREADARVAKVVTIVDRLEGAAENLAREGLDLAALFTRDDFLASAADAR